MAKDLMRRFVLFNSAILLLVCIFSASALAQVLTPERERALKPKDSFKQCEQCPEMVVMPSGSFTMGSPQSEKDRDGDESPQHQVTIAQPFAVGKFEVTFDEWDACVADGGCNRYRPLDQGWGRGTRPVINVSWNDAQEYVKWLSTHTGNPYRLLFEAEWEYVARAGSDKAYTWGDEIGKENANCRGCGSQWDLKLTAPVGSFKANAFGLHDMHGNVWEWVQDCHKNNYNGTPTDGSAWTSGDCANRVLRGGAWYFDPQGLRSANRYWGPTGNRNPSLGFRVARTLALSP
jgi:formylglycine-generating enzyme required for sulfatase activity